jgi:acyl-coenzyme A thioesterase 9
MVKVKARQVASRVSARILQPSQSQHYRRLAPGLIAHKPCESIRSFNSTGLKRTDGVFKELTAMRVVTPWIDALDRKRASEKEQGNDAAATSSPSAPVERNLTPKHMADSYSSVILPLAHDRWLSDSYLNSEGNIRLGALFMDLDALSGVVAYKHTGDGVTTVTAAFDRISLASRMESVCDLELSGRVTHVGKSSMEIELQVAKINDQGEKGDVLLKCSCTMVSLDPVTRKFVIAL